MARENGMFISEYQGSFTNLGNLDYIFQRASDGLVTDDKFYDMLPQVKTIERRGAVHNFRPEKDWKQQADKLLGLANGHGFKMLCGDYESGILDRQAAIDFFCFLSYIQQQRPDAKDLFYTTIYKLRDCLIPYEGIETPFGPIDWHNFDFWLARYYISTDPATKLTTLLIDPQTKVPGLDIGGVPVWDQWTFWQYWADGNQQGAKYGCGSRDTNLDVFNGTLAELDEWLASEVVIPPPPVNCEAAIAQAVAEVSLRYETQIEEMKTKHAAELIKANNTALENLIKPYLL